MSLQNTPALGLPLLQSGQAQKHITLNEALWRLDACVQARVLSRSVGVQPTSPQEGDAYILPEGATGADWSSMEARAFVARHGGYWERLDLPEGALVYIADEGVFVVRASSDWLALSATFGELQNLDRVGIGGTADNTNRLSVNSPQVLFNHAGQGSLVYLNKADPVDEAALVLQSGFSTRAMLGLLGDDRLTLKVSADGSTFADVLTVEADSVGLHRAVKPAADNAYALGGAGARWSEVWAASGVIQTSDRRDKTDISPIDAAQALALVSAISPVRFRWREDDTRANAGFIAQEVGAVLTAQGLDLNLWGLEAPDNSDSRQWLRPDQMLAILWAALKAIREELDALKAV
ncbi:MAG: DUF2793 domain-containing protein [Asticcacaulis sp.]